MHLLVRLKGRLTKMTGHVYGSIIPSDSYLSMDEFLPSILSLLMHFRG